jgi:DNA polymerase III delta prime subunit
MFGNTLWVEKYRPQTVEDCILPVELKKAFKQFLSNNDIPHMLFTGRAGIGKTTVAKAICKEMNCDYLVINGSDESGIDILRNKIKSFASTISLSGGLKIVIIDEADKMQKTFYLEYQNLQKPIYGQALAAFDL